MTMTPPESHKVFVLAKRPTDRIEPDTFSLQTRPTPREVDLLPGQTLVKNLAFSNDPAQRLWMDGSVDPRRLYIAPILAGEAIRSSVFGEVVYSRSEKWKPGDIVFGDGEWAEYSVVLDHGPLTGKQVKLAGHSPYIVASMLGLTGQTAWLGAFNEMKLRPEHTLVVSGAAGGVGSALVQIAKHVIGVKRVIGIAGGQAKCDWVKSLGADECVDYKNAGWKAELAGLIPDYADRFFDNVGGEILDTMLTLVKRHGMICICGAIAGYNEKGFQLTEWDQMIFNRMIIKGMLIFDHLEVLDDVVRDLTKYVEDGTISTEGTETVVKARFEELPTVYQKLFSGANQGKLITELID